MALYVTLLRIYDRYIISPSKPQLQYPRTHETAKPADEHTALVGLRMSRAAIPTRPFIVFPYRQACAIFNSYLMKH